MTLSILSSRDAGPNIAIALSFNVSYGPPSRVLCERKDTPNAITFVQLINHRESSKLFREVIRSRYISSTLPDMTRVTFRPDPQPRQVATYNCYIHVETCNVHKSGYNIVGKGMFGSTSVTATGELYSWTITYTFFLSSVSNPPIAVTASRIDLTAASIVWSAPSSPSPAGYEVFYHASSDSMRVSAVNTTDTSYELSGLTLGVAYNVYVLSYGAVGAPVLPSALVMATVTCELLNVHIMC